MSKVYCMFSANYLPNLGGVERYTYNLAKKLIDSGNRVIVVTSNTFRIKSYEIVDKVEIYRMPCYNILKGRFPVIKYNKEFRSLLKKILSSKVDSVIVNTRFYIHSYLGVKVAKKKRVPCIVIEHGTNHFTVNNKILDFFGHIYEHFITSFIKINCENYYGVSEACVQWLNHFNINANGVLYNAIDVENIDNITKENTIDYREKLEISKDDILITYTGRLVKEKGILKLTEACLRLFSDFPNVYLVIAGDGDMLETINAIEHDHIITLGKVDFKNVVALLNQADIFCLPTDYPEGFPTSVLEAAYCKCFIITTTSGGSKELIINSDYGIIMENNTIEEIYMSLKEAITNEEYRNNAINNSFNRVVNNFTWDIVSNKVMSLKLKKSDLEETTIT